MPVSEAAGLVVASTFGGAASTTFGSTNSGAWIAVFAIVSSRGGAGGNGGGVLATSDLGSTCLTGGAAEISSNNRTGSSDSLTGGAELFGFGFGSGETASAIGVVGATGAGCVVGAA